MTPIELLGLLALGSLIPIALFGGVAAWLFRSHRVDLTGVRIVSTRPALTYAEPSAYTGRAELEWTDAEGKRQSAKLPDLYDLAHGRGEDDQR